MDVSWFFGPNVSQRGQLIRLAMTHPLSFVKVCQPRAQEPCDSISVVQFGKVHEAPESGVQRTTEASQMSVAIQPTSRLYLRSFSEEVKRCSVSSNTVLQCGGAALGNGNERFAGEELFDEKWDMFVSHNWSVKRWNKFLALCLVWSGKKAIVSCFLVQLILFTLVSLKLLPVSQSPVDGHAVSVWCTAGCIITYLAVFLVAHDVLAVLRIPGYKTFLDKVCVDQTDEKKKEEGIQSITAVLSHSETLVVLYSEVYLQRLWTVFELTVFLAVKPNGLLLVQPVILGPVAFLLFVMEGFRILNAFFVPFRLEEMTSLDPLFSVAALALMALNLLGILICAIFLRMWGRTRANMMQQISDFTFAGAKCQVEADRIEIMGAVKALARQESLVPADASTQQCAKSWPWFWTSLQFEFARCSPRTRLQTSSLWKCWWRFWRISTMKCACPLPSGLLAWWVVPPKVAYCTRLDA